MKYPQFSLRMLFLIVALAAVLIAWRQAAGPLERGERIKLLRHDYVVLVEKRHVVLDDPTYPPAKAKADISKIDAELDAIDVQLKDLHPGPTE